MNTSAGAVFKYPLTTNTSASEYCPVAMNVSGTKAHIANVFSTSVSSDTWRTTNVSLPGNSGGCSMHSSGRSVIASTAEQVSQTAVSSTNKNAQVLYTGTTSNDSSWQKYTSTASGILSYQTRSSTSSTEYKTRESVVNYSYWASQRTHSNTTNTRSKEATASKQVTTKCNATDASATSAYWKSAYKGRDAATDDAFTAARNKVTTYMDWSETSVRTGDFSTAGKLMAGAGPSTTYKANSSFTRETVSKGAAKAGTIKTKTATTYEYAGNIQNGATFTWKVTCSFSATFTAETRRFTYPFYSVSKTQENTKASTSATSYHTRSSTSATVYSVKGTRKSLTSASYKVGASATYDNINF
jgi:hypothetical protein